MKMLIGWLAGWMMDAEVEEMGNREGNWVLLGRDGGGFSLATPLYLLNFAINEYITFQNKYIK